MLFLIHLVLVPQFKPLSLTQNSRSHSHGPLFYRVHWRIHYTLFRKFLLFFGWRAHTFQSESILFLRTLDSFLEPELSSIKLNYATSIDAMLHTHTLSRPSLCISRFDSDCTRVWFIRNRPNIGKNGKENIKHTLFTKNLFHGRECDTKLPRKLLLLMGEMMKCRVRPKIPLLGRCNFLFDSLFELFSCNLIRRRTIRHVENW